MYAKNNIIAITFLICGLMFLSACARKYPAPVYYGNRAQTRAQYEALLKSVVNTQYIPSRISSSKSLSSGGKYIVKSGDTLYSIARNNGVSLSVLIANNNIKAPYSIYKGQSLDVSKTKKSNTVAPTKEYSSNSKTDAAMDFDNIPSRSSSKFARPVNGKIVSSFGSKANGLHNDGINIAANKGAPVRAAENGLVVYSSDKIQGLGNLILIKHEGDWITTYAHLDKRLVNKGDVIKRGSTIGTVGNTGSVSSSQLHFEIRKKSKPLDPQKYI